MNTTGELRQLDPSNARVHELDQLHFPRPWKSSEWTSLQKEHHRLWGFFQEDRLIGFALFHVPPSDDTAHLLKIMLLPELRGSGVADQFWKVIISALKSESLQRVYLEVEESNQRAQGFYHRQGFQILRRAKSYYSDGEGAVMMQLTL